MSLTLIDLAAVFGVIVGCMAMWLAFAATTNWRGQRSLNAPSEILKSVPNSCTLQAGEATPIRNGMNLAIIDYWPIRSPVVLLFLHRRPAAIARFVIAVIVDSVNRVFRGWLWPHILIKRFKAIEPAVAYLYSATAIFGELSCSRMKAPPLHQKPGVVFWRMAHAVALNTTTTRTPGISDVSPNPAAIEKLRSSAVAGALPHPSIVDFESFDRHQLAKSHVGVVNCCSHDAAFRAKGAFWLEPAGVQSASSARLILALGA